MLKADFLYLNGRRLLHLCWQPDGASAAPPILILPSLFEELNRGRAIAARLARQLAGAGRTVHLIDGFGTGDSDGTLREVDPAWWRADLNAFCADTLAGARIDVLALRAGALLLSDQPRAIPQGQYRHLVLFQPVLDGRSFLTQFLRTRVAAARFDGREETVEGLRDQACQSGWIEVAGYELGASLIAGLDAMRPEPPDAGERLTLVDVGAANSPIPVPVKRWLTAAESAGWQTEHRRLMDLRFWASQELCAAEAMTAALFEVLGPEAGV